MARSPRPWIVLPHGPVERLEANLWVVAGALPRGPMNRRMAVVRLASGELVLFNAVPLDAPAMRSLEAWGAPAYLVVPARHHRLDVHAWKARYPRLRVLCPEPARGQVEKVVPVDGGLERLPADPALEVVTLRGSRVEEPVLLVRSGPRASLVFADVVMNLAHAPGPLGLLLRVLGTSGGPKVTPIARLTLGDRRAAAAHLARLAATPGLARLVPSHGQLVARDAPGVLREVARGLAGREPLEEAG